MPNFDELELPTAAADQAGSAFREQAPSLAPWGTLSTKIAQTIKHTPGLADRLLRAPRAAFHAAAVYLLHHDHLAPQEAGKALLGLSPIALIAKCFEPAPGYMAALKKCDPFVHPTSFYTELNHLLLSHLAGEISSEKLLSPQLLTFFRETRDLDPLVLPARHGLRLDPQNASYFNEILKFFRQLGIIWDYSSEAKIVRHAATHGLRRYIIKRLERCVSPWSFELPPPLRHIKTTHELIEIASKHANCLGRVNYWVQLGLGSHIYLISDNDCLVELRHEYGDDWSIIECAHLVADKQVSWETREQVCALLREAGINARPAPFEELLSNIENFRPPGPLNNCRNCALLEDLLFDE